MIENINVEYLFVKCLVYNVVFHDEKWTWKMRSNCLLFLWSACLPSSRQLT